MVFSYTGKERRRHLDVEEHEFDDFYGGIEWQLNDSHQLAASAYLFPRTLPKGYGREQSLAAAVREDPARQKRLGRRSRVQQYSVDYLQVLNLTHNFQISERRGACRSKFFSTELDRPSFSGDL